MESGRIIRYLTILLLLAGCAHPAPPHEDQAYWDSPEGQREIELEGNTILRLKEQILDIQ